MQNHGIPQFFTWEEKGRFVRVFHGIRWMMPDGSLRKPEESTVEQPYPGEFTVAGKVYSSWEELCVERDPQNATWALDKYGRRVLVMLERFPCFDSFDYLHENRYYRWFYLVDDGKLFCISYTDERDTIQITQDVRRLKEHVWKALKELLETKPE